MLTKLMWDCLQTVQSYQVLFSFGFLVIHIIETEVLLKCPLISANQLGWSLQYQIVIALLRLELIARQIKSSKTFSTSFVLSIKLLLDFGVIHSFKARGSTRTRAIKSRFLHWGQREQQDHLLIKFRSTLLSQRLLNTGGQIQKRNGQRSSLL